MAILLPNSVFFHVLKTGGVWVYNTLYECNIPVESTGMHNTIVPKSHIDCFKFSFVRNPVDWYISRWRCPAHRARITQNRKEIEDAMNETEEKDFNVWMNRILSFDNKQGLASKKMKGAISKSNFVGKTENLRQDLIKALTLAGENFDPEILLKNNTRNISIDYIKRPIYEKKILEKVLILDRKIIERYGYYKKIEFYKNKNYLKFI